jgi:outer membrane receptor for ferrienterochelin and colicin
MKAMYLYKFAQFGTLAGTLFVLSAICIPGPAYSMEGITEQSLDQLSQTQFFTADTDKIARQISAAPSAVSVVTADDIRTYGYRTLSDILDSMRGLAMAHDGSYGFLSGRGYGNSGMGDKGGAAGRIALLIDGYQANENLYGQMFTGHDALIDVELIDRVEYIPGTGAASDGGLAFLGVINVITKKGRDINGAEMSTAFASHGLRQNRATFGQRFDNGLDLVLSASTMRSLGRHLPTDATGIYDNIIGAVEGDHNERYFLKAVFRGWALESAWVDRGQSSAGWHISDINSFVRLRYDGDINARLKISMDMYGGRYRMHVVPDDQSTLPGNHWTGGNWQGINAKLVSTWFERHTLVLGTEYRDDPQMGFVFHYFGVTSEDLRRRRTTSLYAYDDIKLSDKLNLSLGGRRDARDSRPATLSPNAALVYGPNDDTTLKLSTGVAYRQITPEQEWYLLDPVPEKVTTRELVWEQRLGPRTHLQASLYRYRIDNYLMGTRTSGGVQDANGIWINPGIYAAIDTHGAEVELEHAWANGVRLRTSYAHQKTRDDEGNMPPNVAQGIAKLNLSAPIAGESLRAGLAVRYLGRRLNLLNEYEPAVTVADLTLSGRWQGWSASISVRNLGNASYNEVSGAWFIESGSGAYPADRRNYWIQLGYDFK